MRNSSRPCAYTCIGRKRGAEAPSRGMGQHGSMPEPCTRPPRDARQHPGLGAAQHVLILHARRRGRHPGAPTPSSEEGVAGSEAARAASGGKAIPEGKRPLEAIPIETTARAMQPPSPADGRVEPIHQSHGPPEWPERTYACGWLAWYVAQADVLMSLAQRGSMRVCASLAWDRKDRPPAPAKMSRAIRRCEGLGTQGREGATLRGGAAAGRGCRRRASFSPC